MRKAILDRLDQAPCGAIAGGRASAGLSADLDFTSGGGTKSVTLGPGVTPFGLNVEREEKTATIRIKWSSIKKVTFTGGIFLLIAAFVYGLYWLFSIYLPSLPQAGSGATAPTGSFAGSVVERCPACGETCGCDVARDELDAVALKLKALRHTAWYRLSDAERNRMDAAIEDVERARGALATKPQSEGD